MLLDRVDNPGYSRCPADEDNKTYRAEVCIVASVLTRLFNLKSTSLFRIAAAEIVKLWHSIQDLEPRRLLLNYIEDEVLPEVLLIEKRES